MKVRLNKASKRAIFAIVGSLVLVVSFQNCGKAGFDSSLGDDGYDPSSSAALVAKYGVTEAAKVTSIPFAYDSSYDTITYNSCADSSLSAQTQSFSLKAGAYYTGGVALNQSFFDYLNTNFKPIYPATSLSQTQIQTYLQDSPANYGAIPTMAIRASSDYSIPYNSPSSALGTDVIAMVSTLSNFEISDPMTTAGTVTRYFPFSQDNRTLEGTLKYNTTMADADLLRNNLSNAVGMLTLTYMPDSSQIYLVRAPSAVAPEKKVYGRGYQLGFEPESGNAYNPVNVMGAVYEVDLQNPNTVINNWNCNSAVGGRRRYKVYRVQDAASCPPNSYSDLSNAVIRSELEIVRRHLRADLWNVNVSLKCVVPTTTSHLTCYNESVLNPTTSVFVGVQYDPSQQCWDTTYNSTPPNGTSMPLCAQYISICTKN
jgi:hypothetical protein